MSRRISINGARLRNDRLARGFSGQALVVAVKAGGHALSLKTLYKAETANLLSEKHLLAIGSALKLPVDSWRYAGPTLETSDVPDLTGRWRVLYLAQDDMTEPYVCEEVLIVDQTGRLLAGKYEPLRHEHPDPDEPVSDRIYWMSGSAQERFVRGEYGPLDGKATGNGYFILKRTQDGVWEGFCTFFSMDERIAMSLNIWIREDSRAFHSIYGQQLKKIRAYKTEVWKIAPLLP